MPDMSHLVLFQSVNKKFLLTFPGTSLKKLIQFCFSYAMIIMFELVCYVKNSVVPDQLASSEAS